MAWRTHEDMTCMKPDCERMAVHWVISPNGETVGATCEEHCGCIGVPATREPVERRP